MAVIEEQPAAGFMGHREWGWDRMMACWLQSILRAPENRAAKLLRASVNCWTLCFFVFIAVFLAHPPQEVLAFRVLRMASK